MAQAHARPLEQRTGHAADAHLRGARREGDGAAAGLARVRRQGLHRPSRYAGATEGGRSDHGKAGSGRTLRRAGSPHAVRGAAAPAIPRPQRAHRREVLTMADESAHRTLTFEILRYNPQDPGRRPRMQRYQLEEADSMTL